MLIGDRYRLDRALGSGGFGRVWAARDETLQTDVAVKELFLSEHLSEDDRKDLLLRAGREARNAAKLRDHPNIVSVHDVVTVDGAPWIVMQLVEGGTLQDRLAGKGRLSVDTTEKVAKALLCALDAAHKQGIVHRDIKPANVMVTSQSQILLTDFGIAVNQTDSKLTQTGLVIGSPSYLSPERAQGEKGGPAGDLFSLGITLYEAVEGTVPFHRDNPAGTIHAVAFENTPPMRRAGRLEPLITALLQKDPADRPSIREALRLLDSPAKREETTSETKGALLPPVWTRPELQPPALKPPTKKLSRERKEDLWVAGILGGLATVLVLLYANNTSFANEASGSGGINRDVSSAGVGDCVHHVDAGADSPDAGEWVKVPCWSAATKYTVKYRLPSQAGPYAEGASCNSYPLWVSLGDRQVIKFADQDTKTEWDLCVSPHLND
ncbi:serine/threonine-protein kinase [Streptomyces sp. NPDC002773]|uniref:serine/threonine-protein kinase n=1 Tax=Streptomyces sp. NPDC002773 TaxID=3154430 RepID=UPI0033219AF6